MSSYYVMRADRKFHSPRAHADALLYRRPLQHLPDDISSEEPFFAAPASAIKKHDERCVTYAWLSKRQLFGETYRRLIPDFFEGTSPDTGVMIGTFVPTAKVVPDLHFPGDIDVLVIPYEGDQLVLSSTLAIEIKVVRASFARQHKSPNQFGFSQASALLSAGFPYAAVGHLIVSDSSPEHAWREQWITRIVDADSGACEPPRPIMADMLPADLLQRSHGRLKHNCTDSRLGYFSAYPYGAGMWQPEGEQATLNPTTSPEILEGIYAYYQQQHRHFLWTRRHPPREATRATATDHQQRLTSMIEKMQQDFR